MYRQIMNSSVWTNSDTLKVWVWCLLRAKYDPSSWEVEGESVTIERGQFVTGSFSACDQLGMPKTTVWRHLKKLEYWGNIKIKSGRKFSLITICNYETYQDFNGEGGTDVVHERNASETPTGTVKERKKERKKEQDKTGTHPTDADTVVTYVTEIVKQHSLSIDPIIEGHRFFDHFTSNGWKVSGRAPMKDWKAAARNWIRNAKQWSQKNGTSKSSIRPDSQIARATFSHGDAEKQRLAALEESLRRRDAKRD